MADVSPIEVKITAAVDRMAPGLGARLASGTRAAITWAAGFAEIHAEQSMSRLCAFIFAIVGSVIGIAGACVAVAAVHDAAHHDLAAVAELVKALALLATGFVLNGSVALFTRSKHDDKTAGDE